MHRFPGWALLAVSLVLPVGHVQAVSSRTWIVSSPTHEQTFAYGSESHRQWMVRGRDRHLALSTEFTNDPYVDRVEPRQYDDFVFDFPEITLGADGHTFYYHASGGRSVPVAYLHAGFLGIEEVRLLDNSVLLMHKPHGYLSLALFISTQPRSAADDSRG